MPTAEAPARMLIEPQWMAPVRAEAGPAGEACLVDHAVVVEDDRIVDVLPQEQARQRNPAAERIALPGHLLVPGFVNLHAHAAMALLRGVGDDLPLSAWLRDRIWPLESRLVDPQFVRDGSTLAFAEMLLGGTTCVNDMYFFPEASVEAALAVGIRSAHGIIVVDFPTVYASAPAEYLRKGLALRDRLREHPLVSFCLAPHAPYTVGDDALREIATISREIGLPIHIHVHETAEEVAEGIARHGRRPLARLDALGLVGPEMIAVHAVHMDDDDLRRLAAGAVTVAHCPHSNGKLACGIAPTARMHAMGIRVGIGTDGSASNNRLDLLGEARTAALLAKATSGRADAWPAARTLRAMTLDAAAALGLDGRIGSIEAGKQADLVAVDLRAAELSPVYDPVSQLIYACGREHVSDVWVAGKAVVRTRQLADVLVRDALSEVVGRTGVWQNRVGEILSGRV
ncbi:MAG: TRZ/ATZ family hydrolase [Burkholderiales bacterium]|nr:MAG: TRZ/ATZ family hydrolase [Burkholderiales bacterium]